LWIACALVGCSRQEAGWRHAQGEDSIPAYETYLEQFPAAAHAAEARGRIRDLREEREWARATQLATPEAYQRYLGAYPEGRHAAAAREHLSGFVLARAPSQQRADRAFGAQLGAYSSEAAASADLARMSRDQSDLLAGMDLRILPPAAGAPPVWRLRARAPNESAARELCARLEARKIDCVPAVE
jgi:hypothetical protein